MPVETVVIVPTSRGTSCGTKLSRARLMLDERPVEDALQAFRLGAHWLFATACGSVVISGDGSDVTGSFRSSPTPFSSDAR